MNKLIIGIDPGLNGALAFVELESKTNKVTVIEFVSTPSMQKMNSKGRMIVCPELVKAVKRVLKSYPKHDKHAFLESVHSMPGQGVSSSFSFGKTVGIVEGIFTTLEIPVIPITPQTWKKKFNLLKQEKDASRKYVITNYPELADQFKLKKHVDKADAFLIALYGVKLLNV
mgnify:CR=1 FL=1